MPATAFCADCNCTAHSPRGDHTVCGRGRIDATRDEVPHDVAIAVYRIGQEWLTNVVKHSSASEVTFTLRTDVSKLTLTIADNGVGFDPQRVKKGLGLRGIAERSRMVGGELRIDSRPGAGAELRLVVDAAQK